MRVLTTDGGALAKLDGCLKWSFFDVVGRAWELEPVHVGVCTSCNTNGWIAWREQLPLNPA